MVAVPTKLGRYEIVKHLANGGMAQVLIARATGIEGFERHVVVKRIHADHAADPAFVQMFLDEARTAAALHHNNIVQVHDIGKENGEYFFAMEYVHGQDLRMILKEASRRREKVPWEHVVTIMTSAAAGLHHAHELRGSDRKLLGLVHRDVSPANILIGYDGTVKMVDFGIAKAALRTGEGTRGGALKGKVSYMAPEQCAGKQIDRRSDVYALGVVLYELSTVRRLFKGDNDFMTMSAIVAGDIPPPSNVRPDIPQKLSDIIVKALSKKPADRYQTADEMREALEELANELKLRTSNGALATYMKQMFGAQPEPWLVSEDADLELTVDFDGSNSGMAQASEDAQKNLAIPDSIESMPSSPIARARRRVTEAPPVMSPAGSGPTVKRASGTGANAEPLAAAIPAPVVARTSTSSKPVTIMIPPKPSTTNAPPIAGTAPPPAVARTATPPAGVAASTPAIARTATPTAGTPPVRKTPPAGTPVLTGTPPALATPSAGTPVAAATATGTARTVTPASGSSVAQPGAPVAAATATGTARTTTPASGSPVGVPTDATPRKAKPTASVLAATAAGPRTLPPPRTPPAGIMAPPLPDASKRHPPPPMPAVVAPEIETSIVDAKVGTPAIEAKVLDTPAKPAPKPLDDDAKLRLPTMADDDFTPEESNSRDLPLETKKPDAPVIAKPAREPVAAPAPAPDKKKLAIIAGVALLAIVLVIFFVVRAGGKSEAKQDPPKQPTPAVVDPPKLPTKPEPVADPTPDAAVAVEPDAAEATGSGSDEPVAAGSGSAIDAGSAVGAGSGSAKKRPKYVPPPKKKWNPDELFIKP